MMCLTLLVYVEHFFLGFLAPTEHVDIGERVDFLVAIDVDEVSHLILSDYVNDGVLLVFGHDQL